jgi:hypothetical protein
MSDALEREIANARLEISADTISMSITELTSLYREGTLQIRPEFQRLFRWSNEQKSRLVESVLLGIPLPSLFVSQSDSGTWELVDGLQRVSTLLQLQGVLLGTDGTPLTPLRLTRTKFLEGLEGRSWAGGGDTVALTDAQKLDIRLARLDLKVIKRSSDPKAKFDLFQRLNSFGSTLTPQEIRSAMIAGTNSEALAWLTRLAQHPSFASCVAISERLVEEQYDLELALRFLMLHRDTLSRSELTDFSTRLDSWSVDLAEDFSTRRDTLEQVFYRTFDELAERGGEDVFRKWDSERGQFRGPFLNTSFEVIGLGLGFHIATRTSHRTDYAQAARELWTLPMLKVGLPQVWPHRTASLGLSRSAGN